MAQTLTFADGSTLALVTCRGGKEHYRDAYRDVLSFFIDPGAITLDEADARFTAENCAALVLAVGEEEYAHEGYTERVSLTKAEYGVAGSAEVLICVKMARRTEAEIKLAELETANNILLGLEE